MKQKSDIKIADDSKSFAEVVDERYVLVGSHSKSFAEVVEERYALVVSLYLIKNADFTGGESAFIKAHFQPPSSHSSIYIISYFKITY